MAGPRLSAIIYARMPRVTVRSPTFATLAAHLVAPIAPRH